LVCDTKASQGIRFDNALVDDATCLYIGSDTDVNGDFYDPDPANIMEYSFLNCMQYFSNNQGARMRGFLSTEPDLQKLIVPNNLYLENEVLTQSHFYGVNATITAENTTVEANANTIFTAGYQVHLKEGFHAKSSSVFQASISDNCNFLENYNSAKKPEEVGIGDKYKNIDDLKVFPNPANEIFNIQASLFNINKVEINLYDIQGKLISREVIKNPANGTLERVINVQNFNSGLYFIDLILDGEARRKKIVVK
jgi:hypothetical protein